MNIYFCVVGAVVIVAGFIALFFSSKMYSELAKEKYRNINPFHVASPGLSLIIIGTLIITLPLIFDFLAKKTAASNYDAGYPSPEETTSNSPTPTSHVVIYVPANSDTVFDTVPLKAFEYAAGLTSKCNVWVEISPFGSFSSNSRTARRFVNKAEYILAQNKVPLNRMRKKYTVVRSATSGVKVEFYDAK